MGLLLGLLLCMHLIVSAPLMCLGFIMLPPGAWLKRAGTFATGVGFAFAAEAGRAYCHRGRSVYGFSYLLEMFYSPTVLVMAFAAAVGLFSVRNRSKESRARYVPWVIASAHFSLVFVLLTGGVWAFASFWDVRLSNH